MRIALSSLKEKYRLASARRRLCSEAGADAFRRARSLSIVAFPNKLHSGYALGKVLHLIGVEAKQFDPWHRAQVLIAWQELTRNAVDVSAYVRLFGSYSDPKPPVTAINLECNDISKAALGRANREVFGYALDVDAANYAGPIVQKSDENATHDGTILTGPLDPSQIRADRVYNLLIDNTEHGQAIDFRLVFMKEVLGLCYEKRRPLSDRFGNANSSVSIKLTSDIFSQHEISKIESLCRSIRADYGELDVLRDRNSGRIYVVDFAKTPVGPPNGLTVGEAHRAVFHMAQCWIRNFISEIP